MNTTKIKIIFGGVALGLLALFMTFSSGAPQPVFGGTNITVPSAPTGGYMLISTSTGAFVVATTTVNASTYPGVDMGAKINAAYLACPSIGCHIFVPRGTYNYTTPIVFGTNNKVVILEGEGHGGAVGPYPAQIGGTTLNYTPSTGVAVTVDTNYSNARSVLLNIAIQGPNGTTAASNKGVVFGGTNGAFNGTLDGSSVSGFGTGVQYNAYTSFNVIDNSIVHFNGRNIDEPDTSGANCEDMRISNSVIADANNQAGGATDLYGFYVTESGNCQWNVINTSIDDNQLFSNQYGGTNNSFSFTNVHWENPDLHAYDFVSSLAAPNAVKLNFIGGDMMNDVIAGMSQFITTGAQVTFSGGFSANSNNNVTGATTRLVTLLDTAITNSVSWSGLQKSDIGVTYVVGTIPYSNSGYATGLTNSLSFSIGAPTSSDNGTTTVQNLSGVLDASAFSGADIGAKINSAYAACPLKGCIITVPRGQFSFSTPIIFGTNGKRALLQGTPGGGTELTYTGTATSTRINSGQQAASIDHTSGCGIKNITLTANSRATSSSPIIGLEVGGTNGSDCAVLENVNIQGFGYGLWTSSNTYHFHWLNGVIRNNGQNLHIVAANNSGEGFQFTNAFIVDGFATYGANAVDCIYIDNSANESFNYTGGSIDDCQVHILQANNVTITGTTFENPGAASWGAYTYIVIDNNIATNLLINGATFFNVGAGVTSPTTFISNGGTLTLNGVITRQFGGTTVTNFVTTTGSGRTTWSGFNNVSNTAVTNVVANSLVPLNGTQGSSTIPSIVGNSAGGGLVTFQNLNSTGYSSTDFYDDAGTVRGGFGVGGTGVSAPFKGNFYIASDQSSADLVFMSNVIERARFSGSTGFFGIGTTTPASILQVSSGASATTTVDFGAEAVTAKTCFNVRNNTGAATSFYFVGVTMVIENKRCL